MILNVLSQVWIDTWLHVYWESSCLQVQSIHVLFANRLHHGLQFFRSSTDLILSPADQIKRWFEHFSISVAPNPVSDPVKLSIFINIKFGVRHGFSNYLIRDRINLSKCVQSNELPHPSVNVFGLLLWKWYFIFEHPINLVIHWGW